MDVHAFLRTYWCLSKSFGKRNKLKAQYARVVVDHWHCIFLSGWQGLFCSMLQNCNDKQRLHLEEWHFASLPLFSQNQSQCCSNIWTVEKQDWCQILHSDALFSQEGNGMLHCFRLFFFKVCLWSLRAAFQMIFLFVCVCIINLSLSVTACRFWRILDTWNYLPSSRQR